MDNSVIANFIIEGPITKAEAQSRHMAAQNRSYYALKLVVNGLGWEVALLPAGDIDDAASKFADRLGRLIGQYK